MLTIKQMIQLALAFMRVANWIARKIDQAEWKAQGASEKAAEYLQEWKISTGIADQSFEKASTKTAEERRKSLGADQ